MTGLLAGHGRIDQRSLAMHQAIAEKLRADPGLLGIARDNLDRWYEGAANSRPYFDAWRKILDLPYEEMLALITQDTEKMTAMRQCSPFAGVLEPKERWAIYRQFEKLQFEKRQFEKK